MCAEWRRYAKTGRRKEGAGGGGGRVQVFYHWEEEVEEGEMTMQMTVAIMLQEAPARIKEMMDKIRSLPFHSNVLF